MIIDKKPGIAVVIRDITAVGGAQLNTLRLINRIRSKGYKFLLIGQGNINTIKRHLSRYQACMDIDIVSVAPPKGFLHRIFRLFPNIYFWFPAFLLLWKKRKNFDILHCPLLMESGIICALCEILLKKPAILKPGSAGEYGDTNRVMKSLLSWIIRLFLKNISAFVCISGTIKDELKNILNISDSKLVRIPNGIDMNLYKPAPDIKAVQLKKKYGFSIDKKLILFIGRLEEKKRVDFLIKAFKKVSEENDANTHLLIIGDGSLRAGLENITHKLKLTERITFLGNTPDTVDMMNIADLFVLPSVSEGVANVLLEAMSCCLPIVATDTAENREILTHNIDSLLFDKDSHDDLAEKITYLIKNVEAGKSLSSKARNNAATHFSLESVSQRYIDLYHMLYDQLRDRLTL